MATLRLGHWRLEVVAPVHVRRATAHTTPPAQHRPIVHRDPTPTPGAFEPPADLFRAIASGGRPLE